MFFDGAMQSDVFERKRSRNGQWYPYAAVVKWLLG
jgi:hypothetical protein